MNVHEIIDSIQSRADFAVFFRAMLLDLKENEAEWENSDLSSFLEALAAWVEAMEGYYQNRKVPIPEQPTWKTFAEILSAAKVYE